MYLRKYFGRGRVVSLISVVPTAQFLAVTRVVWAENRRPRRKKRHQQSLQFENYERERASKLGTKIACKSRDASPSPIG